eukprot:Skav236469  [mRNA]  locus=scaffold3359:23727:29371:+ [translate_table: standard]
MFLGVIWWLVREIILHKRKADSGADEGKTDPHLVVPSSLDIMFEGMLDAVCFIIGCGLLILAASAFLQKFGTGTNPGDVLLLCYPLLFGPFALLRIFLCFNRRLLYHNLFLKGVLIDFSAAASRRDPLLLYTYFGFAMVVGVLLFDALQNVQDGNVGWKTMAMQTVIFTSPLYYMVSSLLNSLRVEQEAINRMCMQKLEKGSETESVEPSSEHKLTPISEGIFCSAARERQDLDACIQLAKVQETAERLKSATSLASLGSGDDDDAAEESTHFKLMDMFWVPRLVSGKSETVSTLLVVSMPVVTLVAMLFSLASLAWLIKHRTDVPEIVGLVTDVPGLSPSFNFEIVDYTLFVPKRHGVITLAARSELERTHKMNASTFDGNLRLGEPVNTTSTMLTHNVPLHRKNSSYPTVIEIVASTLSKVLSSEQAEIAFQEFHAGLPVASADEKDFALIYRPNSNHSGKEWFKYDKSHRFWAWSKPSCSADCELKRSCYGYKEVRCYFIIGPGLPAISCLDLHRKKSGKVSRIQIAAKICSARDTGNCAPSTSANQVVTASLDDQVIYKNSGVVQKREFRERTTITIQPSAILGSSFYPDKTYEVNLLRGTPQVTKLLLTPGKIQENFATGRNTGSSDCRFCFRITQLLNSEKKSHANSRFVINRNFFGEPKLELMCHSFDALLIRDSFLDSLGK